MAGALPNVDFPGGFSLSHNELKKNKKKWSNETKTICLINDVPVPYTKRVKEEKVLPWDQKSLLIWDVFKAQSPTKLNTLLQAMTLKQ